MNLSWFQRSNTARRRPQGGSFSIIELLVAMAIIMVAFALLVPAVGAAREKARQGKCASNMRQYGIAFRLYQTEHKGQYPEVWVNNSDNWQSYLCGAIPFAPWIGPNVYLPTNWATYSGPPSFAKRINGKFLCPTIAMQYNIPQEGIHDQWGYCINSTRVEITWQTNSVSGDWPWFKPEYIGGDLDSIYSKSGLSAVMACGNGTSWNSDNTWNAFTGNGDTNNLDWAMRPVHGNSVNTLFMDGHVEAINVQTASGQNQFNALWYNSIPSVMTNTWFSAL